MSTDNGGPAFPRPLSEDDGRYGSNRETYDAQEGMKLRDYFAAKALQGMLANDIECRPQDVPHIAASAYILADAMIGERSK